MPLLLFFFMLLRTGYASRVSTRTDLLSLLIAQLDPKKVHFSKQIISFSQNKDSAEIRCADHTTYKGEILVGSDGAFSRIRTCLYKQVAKKGILPRHDASLFSVIPSAIDNGTVDDVMVQTMGSHFSLVGVTDPLHRDLFPALKDVESRCDTIVGDHITVRHNIHSSIEELNHFAFWDFANFWLHVVWILHPA